MRSAWGAEVETNATSSEDEKDYGRCTLTHTHSSSSDRLVTA